MGELISVLNSKHSYYKMFLNLQRFKLVDRGHFLPPPPSHYLSLKYPALNGADCSENPVSGL